MREIKFRAWHKKENFMLEPKYIKHLDWNDETIYYVGGAYRRYELDNQNNVNYLWKGDIFVDKKESVCDVYFDDINLMQYTGLKDKNNVEIYEGDILYHNLQGNRFVEYGSSFKNYGGYMLVTKNGMRGTLSDTEKLYEVIGNIYENPELLRED